MRPLTTALLSVCCLVLLSAPAALAQAGRRGGQGWGSSDAYGRLYDPAKITTVEGKVLEVRRVKPLRGMSEGIEIVIERSSGDAVVHLGPAWFIEKQKLQVKKGDEVKVEGSSVMLQDKEVVLAATLQKGKDTLQLRDASGVPAWAGWRRRR
jgi:hypothetical protein